MEIMNTFAVYCIKPYVLQLPEGGDFEALTVSQAQTLIEAQSLI
jgi:hypothetical protein